MRQNRLSCVAPGSGSGFIAKILPVGLPAVRNRVFLPALIECFAPVDIYRFWLGFRSDACRKLITSSLVPVMPIDAVSTPETSDADVWNCSFSSTTAAGIRYRLPRRKWNNSPWLHTLEDFLELITVEEGKLKTFGNLNQYAIKPVLLEVNALAYSNVTVALTKTGCRVTGGILGWGMKDIDALAGLCRTSAPEIWTEPAVCSDN